MKTYRVHVKVAVFEAPISWDPTPVTSFELVKSDTCSTDVIGSITELVLSSCSAGILRERSNENSK